MSKGEQVCVVLDESGVSPRVVGVFKSKRAAMDAAKEYTWNKFITAKDLRFLDAELQP